MNVTTLNMTTLDGGVIIKKGGGGTPAPPSGGESGGESGGDVGWFFPVMTNDTDNPMYLPSMGMLISAAFSSNVTQGVSLATKGSNFKVTGLYSTIENVDMEGSWMWLDMAIKRGSILKIEGFGEWTINTFDDIISIVCAFLEAEGADAETAKKHAEASIRNASVDEYLTSIAM